ncbi:MAG: hypothetical protein AAF206_28655, partial [Bacteroidota bacterium]
MKRKHYILLGLIGVFAVLFGCDQQAPFDPAPEKGRAPVHFLNLNDNFGPVDVQVNGSGSVRTVATRLDFEEGWQQNGYASLLVELPDTAYETDSLFVEVLSHDDQLQIEPEKALDAVANLPLSFYLIDSFGTPIIIEAEGSNEAPAGNFSMIRFMNLSPNILTVRLEATGDSLAFENYNFLLFSRFEPI